MVRAELRPRGPYSLHLSGRHGSDATRVVSRGTYRGTAVVDGPDMPAGVADDLNALRLRTQENFPVFGEVDDLTNFEEIQKGLAALEDEWVYMHRGMGIPGRIATDARGVVTAPATDEVFMRIYIQYWKDIMKSRPTLSVARAP